MALFHCCSEANYASEWKRNCAKKIWFGCQLFFLFDEKIKRYAELTENYEKELLNYLFLSHSL